MRTVSLTAAFLLKPRPKRVRAHKTAIESLESRSMLQASPFTSFTGNMTGNPASLGPPALPPLAIQTVAEDFVSVSATPAPAAGGSTVGGGTVGASQSLGSPPGATFNSPGATTFGLQVGNSVNSVDTGVPLGGAGQPINSGTPGINSPNGATPNAGATSYSNTINRLIERLASRPGASTASRNSNIGVGSATSQSDSAAVPTVPPTGSGN
jgi:hypothetical protein